MGKTTKPCPGCGRVDHHRAADKVCYTCEQKLTAVLKAEAEVARMREVVAKLTAGQTTDPYMVCLPTFLYLVDAKSTAWPKLRLSLAAMIAQIAAPLDRGRKTSDWKSFVPQHPVGPDFGGRRDDMMMTVELTKEAAQAIRRFWHDLQEYQREIAADGIQAGSHMLSRLALGELTAEAMGNEIAGQTRRLREKRHFREGES